MHAKKKASENDEKDLVRGVVVNMTVYEDVLDGQNRQSPSASDFGSRTQIATLFAVLLYRSV